MTQITKTSISSKYEKIARRLLLLGVLGWTLNRTQGYSSSIPKQISPSTSSRSSHLSRLTLARLSSTVSSSSTSTFTSEGDADRAFKYGQSLEKAGHTRSAASAFHEAATLYQCYLDNSSSDEFAHVTNLNNNDHDHDNHQPCCAAVLAYACVRLAHLSHDALADSKAAIRLYKDAIKIDPRPSSVAYAGVGTCVEASGGDLGEAIRAYREAIQKKASKTVLFHLAVALQRYYDKDNPTHEQQLQEAEQIMENLRRSSSQHACLVDSWGYVRWHTRRKQNLNLHRGTRAMLQIALRSAMPLIQKNSGLVCEFGVASGRSLRMIQEMLPLHTPLHGFDTFEGLPVAWGDEPAGSYSTGGVLPLMEGNVSFHRGLFSDSIPTFLDSLPDAKNGGEEEVFRPLAFANIDCDLYGSTLDILESFHGRIVPGTVIVFDEYICHPTWRQDEFRAWRECCKRFGWQYEYLAFSLGTKQAVVRVTSA